MACIKLPAPALALVDFPPAEILAILEGYHLGPRAPAILLAIVVGAAATGFFAFSRGTLVDVIERHRGDRHDEQRAERSQAPLRVASVPKLTSQVTTTGHVFAVSRVVGLGPALQHLR